MEHGQTTSTTARTSKHSSSAETPEASKRIWDELAAQVVTCDSNPDAMLDLACRAIAFARESGDTGLQAGAMMYASHACRFLERDKEMESYFREAERLLPRIARPWERMRVLGILAMEYVRRDELKAGLALLREAESAAIVMNNRPALMGNYTTMAIAAFKLGVYEEALEYNLRVLGIQEELDSSAFVRMRTIINTGSVYHKLGDYPKAREYYERALELGRLSGELEATAICLMDIGNVCGRMQGPAESLPYLEEALALFTEMHETMLAAETLSSIGSAYIDLGDDARAAEYLARAQRVAEGTVAAGSTPAMILQRMGRLRERAGDPAAALDCYLRSLDILQELGMPEEQAEVHERLAALYPTLNDYRSAYEHQRRVMALREELAGAERHRAAAAVELRHARLSAERERELLRLRAEDAERQAERQANELGEMLMRLTQRNEAFRSLRELAAPYARDGRGQTKALATSVLRDIAAAVDIDHAWPLFERAHNDFIETLRRRSQRLSAAEIRICVMIRSNLSTKQIADVLFVSDLTVKKHRANIRKKLGLHGDGYLNEWLLTL